MMCCMDCFNDREIKKIILNANNFGDCSYCRKRNVATIEPNSLSTIFEFLLLALEESSTGVKASEILQSSFLIFDDNVNDKDRLVADILGCERYLDITYSITFETGEYSNSWKELCAELKNENRFFLKSSAQKTIFSTEMVDDSAPVFISILEQLERSVSINQVLYRARVSDDLISIDEMGAPPKAYASPGRANPKGISYLYLAENEETCISEVRPYNGCDIYVSDFIAKEERKVIDLTSPRKSVSVIPFSESDYVEVLSVIELLESFSSALSMPVKPHLSELDYLPTQFLCEYIKSLGTYDGIVFNSSFGKGVNYVFFDGDYFLIGSPKVFNLTSIDFSYAAKASSDGVS